MGQAFSAVELLTMELTGFLWRIYSSLYNLNIVVSKVHPNTTIHTITAQLVSLVVLDNRFT